MIYGTHSMFGNTDIIAMSMNAAWQRNKVINANIANVDTPGYKRKDIAFEQYLEKALVSQKSYAEIEQSSQLRPKVYIDNRNLSYRKDRNNVDADTEMAYLANNQLRYNAMVHQINYNFNRLKTVLK